MVVQADAQTRTGGEERRLKPVLDALRADPHRECPFHRPCGRLSLVGMPGDAIDRVQDAKAYPVEAEGGVGHSVHAVADIPLHIPGDVRLPGKIQVAGLVASVEGDGKAVFTGLDGQAGHYTRDGVPVAVADGDVDAANQFHACEADVAQVAVLVQQVQVA